VRGFRSEQEISVEIDRCLEPTRRVETHGNRGGLCPVQIGVHAERLRDVRVGRHVHATERHRLERLFGLLAQDGRGPQADLLPDRRTLGGPRGIAFGTHNVVQRGGQVGVGEAIRHDAVHDFSRFLLPAPCSLDAHDRPDPDGRLVRGPEVELVRRRGLLLGSDDATDGWGLGRGLVDHVPVLGSREPGAGSRSRGARALK